MPELEPGAEGTNDRVENIKRAQDMAIVEDEARVLTERAAELSAVSRARGHVEDIERHYNDHVRPLSIARGNLEKRYSEIDAKEDQGYKSSFKDEASLRAHEVTKSDQKNGGASWLRRIFRRSR